MLNTPDGFTYPQDTDPLANVADWVSELAVDVSPRSVLVSRAAVFAIPNNAYTAVPMDTEDSDVHGQAALAGGVYTTTLSEAGLYACHARAGIAAGAAVGTARGIRVTFAGVVVAIFQLPLAVTASTILTCSGMFEVGLAGVLQLELFQDTGAARNTNLSGTVHAQLGAFRIAKAS